MSTRFRLCLVIPLLLTCFLVSHFTLSATTVQAESRSGEVSPSAQSHRANKPETTPWSIQLLLCMAGAKWSGASMSEAYGQCVAAE